jgi:hypothetical protein
MTRREFWQPNAVNVYFSDPFEAIRGYNSRLGLEQVEKLYFDTQ